MQFELDTHIHTISSGHAYSTVLESAQAAAEKKLRLIAITDHAPAMPGTAHKFHFHNLRVLPDYIAGVRVLKGAECNILDYNGTLDLEKEILDELELVIASFHIVCIRPGSKKEVTRALRKVIDNPRVHIIGHPGDTRYDFDLPEIVRAAKEAGVFLEINNSSLLPVSFRPGGREEIAAIISECRNQGAALVLGSDSHYRDSVGRLAEAYELCRSVSFPDELIVNFNAEAFLAAINSRR
ncbi:MAG: phosphatase [Spirochaetales bacterium]|nr:phosphatase [Spirochaetales bacterium]